MLAAKREYNSNKYEEDECAQLNGFKLADLQCQRKPLNEMKNKERQLQSVCI